MEVQLPVEHDVVPENIQLLLPVGCKTPGDLIIFLKPKEDKVLSIFSFFLHHDQG